MEKSQNKVAVGEEIGFSRSQCCKNVAKMVKSYQKLNVKIYGNEKSLVQGGWMDGWVEVKAE